MISGGDPMSDRTMDRRTFVGLAAAGGAAAVESRIPARARHGGRPAAAPFELEEATIAELQAGMKSAKYTARGLTAAYVQRIDALDRKGPALRAVLEGNPYALDRTPSGSSSGSGVAVAANLCPVAIGTETDGSIVSPSTCCSIVGIKPTLGLVSRTGIIPIAHSQDTAGPMARTVADASVLLGALAGVDPRDDATAASAGQARTDYTAFLDPNGLKGARLGVCRSHFMGYSPATDALMEGAIDTVKRLGAVVVDPADIATAGQFDDAEFTVLLYEFKADLNRYLAEWATGAAGAKTLEGLIGFNDRNKERELPYFGQEIFVQAQA